MNKYEPEKLEPDISSAALYCALGVISAFLILGGLLFFSAEIFRFIAFAIGGIFWLIGSIFFGVGSIISFVYQVTKPLNEAIGIYVCYLLLAISMWAYCLHHKIEDWFEDARKKWIFIHRLFYILFIISMIFVVCQYLSKETTRESQIPPSCLLLFFGASIIFKIWVSASMSDYRPSSFVIEHTEYMKKRVRGEQ